MTNRSMIELITRNQDRPFAIGSHTLFVHRLRNEAEQELVHHDIPQELWDNPNALVQYFSQHFPADDSVHAALCFLANVTTLSRFPTAIRLAAVASLCDALTKQQATNRRSEGGRQTAALSRKWLGKRNMEIIAEFKAALVKNSRLTKSSWVATNRGHWTTKEGGDRKIGAPGLRKILRNV